MNSLVIAFNIIKRLVREVNVLLILIALPIAGGLLAVMMFGKGSVTNIGLAGDDSRMGTALVQAFNDTGRFKAVLMDESSVEKAVESKKIKAGIIMPEGFDEGLAAKNPPKVKLIVQKEDSKTTEIKYVIDGFINAVISGNTGSSKEAAKPEGFVLEKPRMALGMLSMFIMLFTGTGMGLILEEKKMKTFMRTFCAPLKEYEMVLGNLIANFALGAFQIAAFLLISAFGLGIDWGIGFPQLFGILFMYLAAVIGLGIGITGFVHDNQVYSVINAILSTMTCMLGGSFFSTALMNGTLKTISNFMPQKWLMEAYEKLVAGASFSDVYLNVLILLMFGAVFFTFGVKVLRPADQDL